MPTLPWEMIIEILLWLPVKSLLRFRSVSKSFCAIIGSQSFNFQRSSKSKIHRKLIDLGEHRTDDNRFKIHAVAFNDDFQQELVLDKLHPCEVYSPFFSCCNGLVLLYILPSKLSVWNPSTRQYRILPAFPVKHTHTRSFALGYDSVADDYKAVVIISKKRWDISQVWIFEFRSSCWRRIQDFSYVDYNTFEDGGNGDCFVDGAVHFIRYRGNDFDASHIIMAFDVAKETFFIIHENFHLVGLSASRLHVYKRCLSASLYNFTTKDHVDMYVSKKDGDSFTWTRLYSENNNFLRRKHSGRFAIGRVAFSSEGNKVFLSFNRKLCSYDLEEKSLQEVIATNTDYLDIFSYTESLVSLGL